MAEVRLEELPARGASVRDYGAAGDGVADDHSAFQEALNSDISPVIVPRGMYKIGGTLRIGSNTRLLAHKAAHIFLADGVGTGPDVFLLTNRSHDGGNENIEVRGGIWNGNNTENPRGPDEPTSYTGVLINFSNVTHLRLSDMTLRDPESYFIRLAQQVKHFRVEDIQFEAMSLRPNQDGVHLGGYCTNGVIRNLEGTGIATPNDDVVALNGDDANDRAQNLGKTCGPISDIRVQNIRAADCHTFVRMLSVWHPIQNIELEGVYGGCRQSALNLDAGRYCKVPPFDTEAPQYAEGVGELRHIRARDLEVYKSEIGSEKPLVHLETRAYDFTVENFRRNYQRDAEPNGPTFHAAHLHPEATATIGGMTQHQAQTVRESSRPGEPRFYREKRPYSDHCVCLGCQIGGDNTLQIPEGDIEILDI